MTAGVGIFAALMHFVIRVSTHVENLEESGTSKVIRENGKFMATLTKNWGKLS